MRGKINAAALLVALALGLFAAQPAYARNCLCGSPPHQNPYDGLLPAGHQPTVVTTPLSPATLATLKVVIVPSANYNEYADTWTQVWRPGGTAEGRVAFWGSMAGGVSSQQMAGNAHITDPRVFGDRVMQILQASFREVAVAPDLASAHDMHADMYVVIDGWVGTGFGMGLVDPLTAWRGVYVLDGSLNQVFAASNHAGQHRAVLAMTAAQQQSADEHSYDVAIDRAEAPVLAGLRQALGQPPVAASAP